LAGANRKYVSGDDDGILTGLEAASLDLVGTKLVVLSACDTGVGELFVGDGVSSLRQAFLAAGAENVVASLWKVPDEETADLISKFVKRFADGEGVAEALRQAQLDTITERRASSGAAHPYYWASFTSTGRWRYPNRFQYHQLGDGIWMLEERWPDGSIKMRSNMRANELGSLVRDGKFSQWYKSGQMKVDGQFRNGWRDGSWIDWHDGGVKASESTYVEGVLSGPFTDWNSAGKPTMQGRYVEDRLSGTITTWDDDTGYRTEIEYSNGKMDGPGILYNRDGNKVFEAHYRQGLLHGTKTYFSEDGEKFLEMEYANGILVEQSDVEDTDCYRGI
jgi:antitoxin component YwqK of YwqJK toxin-antitoxin module